MATFYSDTITVGTYTRARIVVKETEVNHITNKTKGEFYVEMWRTNSGYTTYGEGTLYLKMTGEDAWTTSSITVSQKLTYNSYTQIGSKKSFTLTHNSSGGLTCKFYAKTSTNNDNITFGEKSFNVTLTSTDRTTPTVTHSVSSLSSGGFKISISASENCDTFQYSIDGGSTYTTCSTTVGKSASVTLSGLSSNTYSVRTRARKDKNELYGYSAKATVDIVPPTVSHSVSNITASSFDVSISASTTCDLFQYSTDGGSTYVTCSSTAGTSAKATVSNLEPNTSYSVRVRARKKSNSLYGYSAKATSKTLGASVITATHPFNADVSTPVIEFKCTVYDSAYYHKVSLKTGSETLAIGTFKASASGSVTQSFTVSSANRTKILSAMSTVKSKDMTLVLDTYSNSSYDTKIGSSSTMTISAKTTSSSSAPTFGGFTYSDSSNVSSVTGDNQILVQSMSTLKIVCQTGVAKNGATSLTYSATIGNATISSSKTTLVIDSVDVSGDLTLKVTCTDSRGYSTSKSVTVTVIEYEKPKISKFVVKRKNDVEAIVGVNFNGSVSPIEVDGVQKNTVVDVRYKYKNVTEGSDYVASMSIFDYVSISGSNYSSSIVDLGISFDTEDSFVFYMYVYDSVTSALTGGSYATRSKSVSLPAAQPSLSLRKKDSTHDFRRVGINNNSPEYPLDVGATDSAKAIAVNGVPIVDYIIEQGTSGNWTYTKYSSGKAEGVYRLIRDITISSSYESWYYVDLDVNFPTALFSATPLLFPSVGGRGIMTAMHFSSDAESTVVRVCSASSGTFTNQAVSLYAVGRWK